MSTRSPVGLAVEEFTRDVPHWLPLLRGSKACSAPESETSTRALSTSALALACCYRPTPFCFWKNWPARFDSQLITEFTALVQEVIVHFHLVSPQIYRSESPTLSFIGFCLVGCFVFFCSFSAPLHGRFTPFKDDLCIMHTWRLHLCKKNLG